MLWTKVVWEDLVSKTSSQYNVDGQKILYIYICVYVFKVTELKSYPEHLTPMMAVSIHLTNRQIDLFVLELI